MKAHRSPPLHRASALVLTLTALGAIVSLAASPPAALAATAGTAAGTAAVAAPHDVGQGYLFLRIHEDSIVVRLEMTVADLNEALGLGWDAVSEVGQGEVERALGPILRYAAANTEIRSSGTPLDLVYGGFDVRFLEVANYVQLYYVIESTGALPDELEITFAPIFEINSSQRNFLVVEHNWKTATFNSEAIAAILSPSAPTQTLDLSRSSTWRGFLGLIRLGVWHIWIGADHILFLMALVLPSVLILHQKQWQPAPGFREALVKIVTIVTFFTIAHSVTLSLAALDVIRLPSRFVESIIAGSIAVAALHNLVPGIRVKEASIAFAFGLFHGFGFATVLGDIGLGQEFLVLSLLGFNVGVEIGQIAIIALVFPVLFVLRSRAIYGPLMKSASVGLIAIAMLWFAERVFDFNVPLRTLAMALIGSG